MFVVPQTAVMLAPKYLASATAAAASKPPYAIGKTVDAIARLKKPNGASRLLDLAGSQPFDRA